MISLPIFEKHWVVQNTMLAFVIFLYISLLFLKHTHTHKILLIHTFGTFQIEFYHWCVIIFLDVLEYTVNSVAVVICSFIVNSVALSLFISDQLFHSHFLMNLISLISLSHICSWLFPLLHSREIVNLS